MEEVINLVISGYRLNNKGNPIDAISKLEEAEKSLLSGEKEGRIERSDGLQAREQILMGVISALRILERFDQAVKLLSEYKSVAEDLGDHTLKAKALMIEGNIRQRMSQYEDAVKDYDAALDIYGTCEQKKPNILTDEATTIGNKGLALLQLRRLKSARKSVEDALLKSEAIKDHAGQKRHLLSLGNILSEQSYHLKAIDSYKRALKIAKEYKLSEFQLLQNLGNEFMRIGSYEIALGYQEKALAIAEDNMIISDVCQIHKSCIIIQKHLGDFEEARNICAKSLNRCNRIVQEQGIHMNFNIYNYHGDIYELLEDFENAQRMYEQVLELCQDDNQYARVRGEALGKLARVLSEQNKYNEAIRRLESALIISQDRQIQINHYNRLGDIYRKQKEGMVKAIEKYRKALSIAKELDNKSSMATCFEKLGHAYSKLIDGKENCKNFEMSKECFEKSLKIREQKMDKRGQIAQLENLCFLHYEFVCNYEAAIEYGEKSNKCRKELWRNLTDDGRRITFDDLSGSGTLLLQSAYYDAGMYENALQTHENSLARALNRLLSDNSLFEMNSERKLSDMQSIASDQRATIIMYSGYQKGGFIIWVIGEEMFHHIFVPSGQDNTLGVPQLHERMQSFSLKFRRKRNRNRFQSAVNPWLDLTNEYDDDDDDDENDVKEDLSRWYNILIRPIYRYLPDAAAGNHLIIVPTRDLFAFPFAALYDKEKEKYLIQDYSISYAPSICSLKHIRDVSIPRNQLTSLIVGNPSYHEEWNLKPLEKALAESEIINGTLKRFCPDGNLLRLNEKDALTSDVVKSMKEMKPNIIHFASHGRSDGIFLSGDSKDDSFLSMEKVATMNLEDTKLVVLSACNTFRGRVRTDGVIGISRAFLAAGASGLIASLCPVDDEMTQLIMTKFYETLLFPENQAAGAEIDVAKALQNVMKEMIEEKEYVCHWAPFILYGQRAKVVVPGF